MSSLSGRVRARSYLALHRAVGSPLPRRYREFLAQDRSRSYPGEGELLAGTLRHAVATVPHYRFRASATEIDRDPFDALARFPVLTRETVRASWRQMLSESGERSEWVENTSGGSTGEPVPLRQDPEHLAWTIAARQVYSTWVGASLGDPELYIWGSAEDLEGRAGLRNRLGNRLLRRTLLNAFMLTDERIEAILRRLRRGRPRFVIAYAQAGYEVARYAARNGIDVPPQRGAIATAGTLYPFMREQLETTFGCPVANRYGTREIGDIAGECEHRRGLHVLPWTCHVEVLDGGGRPVGPGEEGDIAVTGYANRAMPLIRYLIGDRARLPAADELCPCGRRTQMLAEVTGRSVDMFLGSGGQMVDGEYFTHLLYFRPWLRQFQVVQRAPEEVVFRLACSEPPPDADREELAAKTRSALGEGCAVSFEEVERIEPSPSGKLRYTIRDF
jgi:phenylacetate-CoA ligase